MAVTKPFHYGSRREGSLARDPHDKGRVKEDGTSGAEREPLREPIRPTTLWLCPNGCSTEYAGFLNPAKRYYTKGRYVVTDQTICPGCGAKREPYAVIAIRRVGT